MPKRILQGVVVSDKGDKTIVVKVERRFKHPLYKKYIRSSKKYHAHDADNKCRVGETVRIVECRPISKTKKWEVLEAGIALDATAQIADVAADATPLVADATPEVVEGEGADT